MQAETMKILVVEDNLESRLAVKKTLEAAGYEAVEAEDGQAAWEIFQREPFRMVVTDWIMPKLDGIGLIDKIRSNSLMRYTYIIMLTAQDDTVQVVRGLESGADEYLTKPFDIQELLARVASGKRILDLENKLTQSRDRMEKLALQDGLTGVFNRRAIEEHANAEIEHARRKHRPVSMIMLDIDHFKSINDRYGHIAGDQALIKIAQVLSMNLRSYDQIGRWGGEEFIIVMPDTVLADAIKVAERMRKSVADTKFPIKDGGNFRLTSASASPAARTLSSPCHGSSMKLIRRCTAPKTPGATAYAVLRISPRAKSVDCQQQLWRDER